MREKYSTWTKKKKKNGHDRFTVENLLIITPLEIRLRRIRQPDILFDWNQARINSWKKKKKQLYVELKNFFGSTINRNLKEMNKNKWIKIKMEKNIKRRNNSTVTQDSPNLTQLESLFPATHNKGSSSPFPVPFFFFFFF